MKTIQLTPSVVMWGISLPTSLLRFAQRVCCPLADKSRHRGVGRAVVLMALAGRAIMAYLRTESRGWKSILPTWEGLLLLPWLLMVYGLSWVFCILLWAGLS